MDSLFGKYCGEDQVFGKRREIRIAMGNAADELAKECSWSNNARHYLDLIEAAWKEKAAHV